jgi:hypothetical protein
MIMKTRIILTGILLMCLSLNVSAQSKKKMTPVEYNDQMADITDSLYTMGKFWGTKFNDIYNGDKDYSKLAPARKSLTAYIIRTTERIKRQPTVGKGGEGLKSAVISFLNFENKMIENAFTKIEKLTVSSTQEEVEAAYNHLTTEASKEEEVLKLVNAAQEAYGAQNDFAIEAAETAEE